MLNVRSYTLDEMSPEEKKHVTPNDIEKNIKFHTITLKRLLLSYYLPPKELCV